MQPGRGQTPVGQNRLKCSGSEIRADEELRQEFQCQSGPQNRQCCIAIIGAQRARGPHCRGFACPWLPARETRWRTGRFGAAARAYVLKRSARRELLETSRVVQRGHVVVRR